MSGYVWGTTRSYADYLQARSFELGIRDEIAEQTSRLIASTQRLEREHEKSARALSTNLDTALSQLRESTFERLDNMVAEIAELGAIFEWGFAEVLDALSLLSEQFSSLLEMARTPTQTWSFEQYEIARDAFRRKLYVEALRYLDRAIDGYGSNPGYDVEYRFHMLKATIRLGSFDNVDPATVDLREAELAFAKAARYARHDQPQEAAKALLGAGWAAYCQGRLAEARDYTLDALELDGNVAESYFQLAKVYMQRAEPNKALLPLREAINRDRAYAPKAISDGAFEPHVAVVFGLIQVLMEEAQRRATRAIETIEKDLAAVNGICVDEYALVDFARTELLVARKELEEARTAFTEGNLYGFLQAEDTCERARQELRQARESWRDRARRAAEAELNTTRRTIADVEERGSKRFWWASSPAALIGGLLAIPVAIRACVPIAENLPDPGLNRSVGAYLEAFVVGLLQIFVLGPLVFFGIIALGALGVGALAGAIARGHSTKREKAKDRERELAALISRL